jgi:hypothetical protein
MLNRISVRTYSKVLKRCVELGHFDVHSCLTDQYVVKQKPVFEVAMVLGISPSTLQIIMRDNGIPMRKQRGRRR